MMITMAPCCLSFFRLVEGAALRAGKIRRLIINLPPRHLKSLMASIAFPAWCLGLDPSAQILCVSYAQDLADKLARLPQHHDESVVSAHLYDPPGSAPPGGAGIHRYSPRLWARHFKWRVLTGRGADIIIIDDPLKPEALRRAVASRQRMVRPHRTVLGRAAHHRRPDKAARLERFWRLIISWQIVRLTETG
jgi:hypothetical protein